MLGHLLLLLSSSCLAYLWLLNRHITPSYHAEALSADSTAVASKAALKDQDTDYDEKLLRESEGYDASDRVLQGTPAEAATNKRYMITGACGAVGSEAVKMLVTRGERHVYAVDIAPLLESLQGLPGVTYIKMDLSDLQSVQAAFEQAKPDVVLHIGSVVRPWERCSFMDKYSAAANVDGTRNIITCLQAMTSDSEKILVYCSTAGIETPPLRLARLGFGGRNGNHPFTSTRTISDEHPLPRSQYQDVCYQRSKRAADDMVLAAHGQGGLRTGIIRPGMALIGPKDLLLANYIRNPTLDLPCFATDVKHTAMDVRDVAASHLLYEVALRTRPNEVGGDAFLVTGDRDAWNFDEILHAAKVFGADFKTVQVPVFALYLMSHFIEAFICLRFYLLSVSAYAGMASSDFPLYPEYLTKHDLHRLQPGYWDCRLTDISIDDTRARKVLGYRNKFSNAQTHRWVVESVRAELAQQRRKGGSDCKDSTVEENVGQQNGAKRVQLPIIGERA